MSGPETRFYTAVHKALPKSVHREKMHNPYRGGTPDVWYSGDRSDLWVEYKWLAKLPVRTPVRLTKLLSPLQLRWLRGRYEEGRNVAVVLGTPVGAWWFDDLEWEKDLDPAQILISEMTKHEVADIIYKRTTRE